MANLEQMKKEELLQLLQKIKQQRKYGLVWEDKPEDVAEQCKSELPVFAEDKNKALERADNEPTNIIIEGDNYHALSVLNYTHYEKVDVIYIDPPYNTGAKDWKYNNDYVDENDQYRHSKWLSMMDKRLRLARRLLKPDGVLIVTIDDHELFGLLGLLENLNAKSIGRVSICIKPEGRRQSKYIMEAHEYALFVTWGDPHIRGLNVDFGLDFPEEDKISKFRWEGLMRRDAPREDRGSEYWYPFYVFKNGKISMVKKRGAKPVWPINTKGIERVWLWDKDRAADNLAELQAVVRKGKATIYYKRREQGRVKPTSFWYGSKYNANAYGTRLVASILPGNDFDYPKSLYSVIDCIDLFLPDDGLVLDFFAGSGTTGHAVLVLNQADKQADKGKGHRRFILCTNNENNIAEDVTYPRIKGVVGGYGRVPGIPANVRYFRTAFVSKSKASDDTRRELVKRSTEMICVKENSFKKLIDNKDFKIYQAHDTTTGILFNLDQIHVFKQRLNALSTTAHIYVFSLTSDTFDEDFEDIQIPYQLCPIPESILEVYRRIFKE